MKRRTAALEILLIVIPLGIVILYGDAWIRLARAFLDGGG